MGWVLLSRCAPGLEGGKRDLILKEHKDALYLEEQ
jgi:hypothetical protein